MPRSGTCISRQPGETGRWEEIDVFESTSFIENYLWRGATYWFLAIKFAPNSTGLWPFGQVTTLLTMPLFPQYHLYGFIKLQINFVKFPRLVTLELNNIYTCQHLTVVELKNSSGMFQLFKSYASWTRSPEGGSRRR